MNILATFVGDSVSFYSDTKYTILILALQKKRSEKAIWILCSFHILFLWIFASRDNQGHILKEI